MEDLGGNHSRACAGSLVAGGLAIVCYARLMSGQGAAHFLHGVVHELELRGHRVRLAGPEEAPEQVVGDAQLVVVHDGLSAQQIHRIGQHRRRHGGYRLLLRHTALQGVIPSAFDLSGYDGVLAASRVIAEICLSAGAVRRAWVWPDAADTRRFCPQPGYHDGDVVFFGAWGDRERGVELRHFLLDPARLLTGLRVRAYGPPFPVAALAQLAASGISFEGWAPHDQVPQILGRHRCTIHIPSRQRARSLPGLPSIRLFEAMACGVPLVSAPWTDCDGLFTVGRDFLMAADGAEMRRHLRNLMADADLRAEIGQHARGTILARHSCAHRAEELLSICAELDLSVPPASLAD